MQTPIRAHVTQVLNHGFIQRFHEAVELGAEAVTGSGVGLDCVRGERVLAATKLSEVTKGYEHRLVVALTDERVCLSGFSSVKGGFNPKFGSVRYQDLRGMTQKTGLLANYIRLAHDGGTLELTFESSVIKQLIAFFEALKAIPAEQRLAPNVPPVMPSEQDPTGAQAAVAALFSEDARAQQMLMLIQHQAHAGVYDLPTAQDLVGRVVLAHRSRLAGAGMIEGRWLSPLPAMDLGPTLMMLFGAGRHQTPQPGVHCLDFDVAQMQRGSGAGTALKIASHLALGVGLSPGKAIANSMLRKPPVRILRFLFADLSGCSGFRLLSPDLPLETNESKMALGVHRVLSEANYAVLTRRVEVGWQVPFESLGVEM